MRFSDYRKKNFENYDKNIEKYRRLEKRYEEMDNQPKYEFTWISSIIKILNGFNVNRHFTKYVLGNISGYYDVNKQLESFWNEMQKSVDIKCWTGEQTTVFMFNKFISSQFNFLYNLESSTFINWYG